MTMKRIYEVDVRVEPTSTRYRGLSFFDRMPTVAEILEFLEGTARENDEFMPGFTEAVSAVVRRGIPAPPLEHWNVSAEFRYPDGMIRVTRRALVLQEATP